MTAEDITFDTSVLGLGFSDHIDAELCAALALLNDMKTFEETQVSPASEGPGKSKQRNDSNDK